MKNMTMMNEKCRFLGDTGVLGVLRCELIEYSTPERTNVYRNIPTVTTAFGRGTQ